LLRLGQALRGRRKERREKLRNRFRLVGIDTDRAALKFVREGKRLPVEYLAIGVNTDELEIVGDDDVVRHRAVFLDLFGLQYLVEVDADVLHLDIAEDHALALDLEIRCANPLLAPRFLLHRHSGRQRIRGERL
jgi:hypothetical protein